MKLVIVGGGIAGALAAGAFANEEPKLLEMRESKSHALEEHKAIMRIRDSKAALLLGCSARPILVRKAIYYQGMLHTQSNITTDNLYSLKTYGELGYRSSSSLQEVQRYLLEGDIVRACHRGYELKKVTEEGLVFQVKADRAVEKYDFCISTIPLPILAKCCGEEISENDFRALPIWIVRAKVRVPSEVHQTIYIPEKKFSAYRVTLQEQDLIIEAVAFVTEQEIVELLDLFGLDYRDVDGVVQYEQKFGKLCKTDERLRKGLIHRITKRFRIFSFGRFGIWKPIRIDHLLSDIEKIRRMMEFYKDDDEYSKFKQMLEAE